MWSGYETMYWRLWRGSMRRPMTTCSGEATRWTLRASARSRARSMSAFAKRLCPPGLFLSAISSGCSENLVPQARTVATNAGCKDFSLLELEFVGYNWSRLRNWAGLSRGSRVWTIWKNTSTRSRANLRWLLSALNFIKKSGLKGSHQIYSNNDSMTSNAMTISETQLTQPWTCHRPACGLICPTTHTEI